MIMAIVKVMAILHLMTTLINTVFSATGAMAGRNTVTNMTEATIVLLATETVANITMTATAVAITSSEETVVNVFLPIFSTPVARFFRVFCAFRGLRFFIRHAQENAIFSGIFSAFIAIGNTAF